MRVRLPDVNTNHDFFLGCWCTQSAVPGVPACFLNPREAGYGAIIYALDLPSDLFANELALAFAFLKESV